jgi:hypothetical protein
MRRPTSRSRRCRMWPSRPPCRELDVVGIAVAGGIAARLDCGQRAAHCRAGHRPVCHSRPAGTVVRCVHDEGSTRQASAESAQWSLCLLPRNLAPSRSPWLDTWRQPECAVAERPAPVIASRYVRTFHPTLHLARNPRPVRPNRRYR